MSNKRAVETLGMSHGAACNRLRKMVLFRQLTKYGDNVCVRCGQKIENIEELSIEHIKPWEGISAELFWDLDNVAFSHLRCNTPHRRHGGVHHRKIGPEGTTWCAGHKDFISVDKFYKIESRWKGYHPYCIECFSKVRKEYPSRKILAC
jgi:hypothetical protein